MARPTSRKSPHATRRRRALADAAKAAQTPLDALLVSHGPDVAYLTGFTGDDSFLLVQPGRACLITDARYDEQARSECDGLDLFVRTSTMAKAVTQVLSDAGVSTLGVQGDSLTLGWQKVLDEAVGPDSVHAVSGTTRAQRAVKDDKELKAIRRAIRIAEASFKELTAAGKKGFIGRTERDVAAELDYLMCKRGASKPSFDTIVAAGANASRPHHRPGETVIQADQAVLIDWGALAGGYCSDLTRVVFTGRIPPEIAEIYEVVMRAQEAGIAAIRSGVAGKTPDLAAREVMATHGLEDKFGHGLGHGLGREIHELPVLNRANKVRLRAGMVVTVEPGIYLPGVGGVRIEDDVLVTPDGGRKLTTLPRALNAMVLT